MRKATDKMENLIISLPLKDRNIAKKFIAERKFQDLHDLVKSDIRKYESLDEEPKELQKDVDIHGMNSLLAEVISYLNIIGWDEDIVDDDEEEY